MDKNLEKRIQALEQQMAQFQNSSTISYNVEKSFQGRGFVTTGPMGKPPGDWDINEGFIVDPALVSEVQAPATQYLRVTSQAGENWFIALYNFSEIS